MPHKEGKKAIHPRCGQQYPSGEGSWTPALIKRHEQGCLECQAKLESENARSQSEYQTSKRVRERLANFWDELDEAPFETADDE